MRFLWLEDSYAVQGRCLLGAAMAEDDRARQLVTVAEFWDPHEAAYFRNRLEAEGFLPFLPDEYASSLKLPPFYGIHPMRLQVPYDEADAASGFIHEIKENAESGRSAVEETDETPLFGEGLETRAQGAFADRSVTALLWFLVAALLLAGLYSLLTLLER